MKNKTAFILIHIISFFFVLISTIIIYLNHKSFALILIIFFLLYILTVIMSIRFYYKLLHTLQVVNQYDNDSIIKNRMLRLQETMLDLSNYMVKINGLNELLDIILKKVIDVIPGAEFGSILVMNEEGQLEFKAIFGFEEELFKIKLNPEECYQWRATNGHFSGPIIIQDLSKSSRDFMSEDTYSTMNDVKALSTKSSISAPLLIDGQFFGSINIDSSETNIFTNQDIKLMAYFANQVTIAIKNQQYYEKIIFMSKYDSITGAMNRHYFEEYAETILHQRNPQADTLTFVIMDLNNFKDINDQYGHNSGDMVLALFADSFSSLLSQEYLFARYGGDEFIAIFFHSTIAETAQKLSSIYNNIIKRPILLTPDEHTVHCSFSYGMAEFPSEGTELKSLIQLADQRMYQHKNELKSNII
ncbi:MAG: sensor domain-containing diguanylate cyclase [Mobilitalea sp.]